VGERPESVGNLWAAPARQGAQQRCDAPLGGGVELALLGQRDQPLDLLGLDLLGLRRRVC